MDKPTAANVRDWATGNGDVSLFDFGRFGYAPSADGPDKLDRVVDRAVAYVEEITARTLGPGLPDGLEPLAEDAVLMRVQQVLVQRSTGKATRDAISSANVISFRAGDYQETRLDPTIRRGGNRPLTVNPWQELNDTLVALMTPERRAFLLAEQNGVAPPLALSAETVPVWWDTPYTYDEPFGYW